MRRFSILFSAISLCLISLGQQPESSRAEVQQPLYVSNEIIIGFRPHIPLPVEGGLKAGQAVWANEVLIELDHLARITQIERLTPTLPLSTDLNQAFDQLKGTSGPTTLAEVAAIFSEYGLDRMAVVRLAQDVDVPALATDLTRRYPDLIEFAEPNYLQALNRRPNDAYFSSQWYLQKVDAEAAWDLTIGGPEVVIAIVDTGISAHPDLDSKRFNNPGEISDNNIDDDNNGFVDDISGWDFFDGDKNPDERTIHGSWVSGVAAAATNNTRDIAGMGWNARFLPLKACCLNGSYFTTAAEIRAINYATMMVIHGVRVINMSFGGPAASSGVLRAIQAAGAANILCVASSGNDGKNNDLTPHYPSGFELENDNVISVASTNSRDQRSYYSNFGLSVGVGAPGDGILTTTIGNRTTSVSGTSFAAPLVSGIAALIYSQFPHITPLQVRGRIEGNVDVLTSLKGQVLSGGRVNAGRVFEFDDIPPAPITDLQVVDGSDGPVITWTAPGDDGMDGRASFYDIRYLTIEITPDSFRYTKRLMGMTQPGTPGTTESLTLPEDFPARGFVLIRVLDNVGNLTESNQVEVVK